MTNKKNEFASTSYQLIIFNKIKLNKIFPWKFLKPKHKYFIHVKYDFVKSFKLN